MAVTAAGTTSYSSAGTGLYAGWRTEHERDLQGYIVMKWLEDLRLLSVLPRETCEHRRVDWPVYTNRTVNSTWWPEITRKSDHTHYNWEPFMLNNATGIQKQLVGVGVTQQNISQNWVRDHLGKSIDLALRELLRGVELNLWTSEFSDPAVAGTVRSPAGLGLNAAGTGVQTLASAKWSTDITDTNSRMYYNDENGAVFTESRLETLHENVRTAGSGAMDLFCDLGNKRRVNAMRRAAETVQWKPAQHKSEVNVEMLETTVGVLRVHTMLNTATFPARAVALLDLDEECICWGPLQGSGIKLHKQGLDGDIEEHLVRMEWTMKPKAPHAHGILYDTAS